MTDPDLGESLGDWIHDLVDRSATRIEQLHKSIAEIPLDVMRRSELFEETADDLIDLQERSIGTVYGAVREVNRRVAELTSDLLRPSSPDTDVHAE